MTLHATTVRGTRRTGHAPPRLALRDRGGPAGPVDGAWWPRTGEPAAELHELITAVAARLGHMVRIGFDWRKAGPDRNTARRAAATGDVGIMYLYGSNGARLDMLVIPAHTPSGIASAQMSWAAGTPWLARPIRTATTRAPSDRTRLR
ncbi:DUF5994 family protein [Nocardia otitidiscaviarum]|uniref:DUF5994 family protein n=1 Tax=Nocardia otitidiscaviarum TaxID=1823 RepID=UPI002454F4BD|nr:DUF5994 family protein [Nocardia otitidiscaviarum]